MSQSGNQTVKRQRIAQACHQCRKRKSKCGGEVPSCLVCLSSSRTCTYDESGFRKRGLQPGYVRGLEALLGLSLQDQPDQERRLRVLIRSPGSRDMLNPGSFADCAGIFRKSTLAKELEQLISLSDDFFESSSDVLSPLSAPADTIEQFHRRPALGGQGESPQESYHKEKTPLVGFTNLAHLQFPEQALELVDFYFTHIHCWLPMLERRDILRMLHSEGLVEGVDVSLKGCLWAVIMYSLYWTRLVPSAEVLSERIQAALHHHLYSRLQDWELGDIQALLIIALQKIGLGHFQAAWTLIGQATRMLIAYQQRPPRYTHTLLGCILLDNFVSALIGKKSYFLPGEPDFQPLDENSLEEWEPWTPPQVWGEEEHTSRRNPLRAISGFNLISHLTHRLSQLNHAPPNQLHHNDYMMTLKVWKASLAMHHQMRTIQNSNPLVLNLDLLWRYVVSFVVIRCKEKDSEIGQLALENASSIRDVARAIVPTKASSIPLLLGCLVQSQKSVEAALRKAVLDTQSSEAAVRLIMDLQALQDDMKQPCASADVVGSSAMSDGLRRHLWTGETAGSSGRITDWEDIGPVVYNPITYEGAPNNSMATSAHYAGAAVTPCGGSNHHPFLVEVAQDPILELSGGPTSSHSNDFDTLLEGMSSFVPPKRSDFELDFAQNLGFVSEDLDPDFLTFMLPEVSPNHDALDTNINCVGTRDPHRGSLSKG